MWTKIFGSNPIFWNIVKVHNQLVEYHVNSNSKIASFNALIYKTLKKYINYFTE